MWRYNYTPSSDELYHYGREGMHWGVRNGPPYPLDRASSATKAGQESVKAAKEVSKIAKKAKARSAESSVDISSMSDAELKNIVKRMNLEQQYKDLSAKNISEGQQKVDTVLDYAGSIAAIGASAIVVTKAISKIVK